MTIMVDRITQVPTTSSSPPESASPPNTQKTTKAIGALGLVNPLRDGGVVEAIVAGQVTMRSKEESRIGDKGRRDQGAAGQERQQPIGKVGGCLMMMIIMRKRRETTNMGRKQMQLADQIIEKKNNTMSTVMRRMIIRKAISL